MIASEIVAFGFTERGLFLPRFSSGVPSVVGPEEFLSAYLADNNSFVSAFGCSISIRRVAHSSFRYNTTTQAQALIANLGSYLQPALPNFNFTLSSALSFSCRRGSNRKVLPSKV